MSRKKMAGKDKETIAKETAEEAKAKKAAAEAAAKEAATLEAAAKEATKEAATKEAAAKEASKEAAAKEAAAKQAAKEAATKEAAAKEATKAATNKDAAAKKAAKEATSKEAAAKDAATRAAAAKEAAEKEAAAKEAAQWRGHHYWEWHHCVQCSFPLYPMSSYKSQKLLTAWVFFALASLEVVGAVGVTNDWFITVIPGGSQNISSTYIKNKLNTIFIIRFYQIHLWFWLFAEIKKHRQTLIRHSWMIIVHKHIHVPLLKHRIVRDGAAILYHIQKN